MNDLNTGFYDDLDSNFNQALEMAQKTFSHSELIDMLESGNILQKQIAALRLERLNNIYEAKILFSNLVGCDGKIREAVASAINRLLIQNRNYVMYFNEPELFANATIDINGNICRLTIDSVALLKENQEFAKNYLDKILEIINNAFNELDKFIFRDKKYKINKQLFKLYWALESIKLFINDIEQNDLKIILERASLEKEYTIREKVAQIIKLTENTEFDLIKSKLITDENYYVRCSFNEELNH